MYNVIIIFGFQKFPDLKFKYVEEDSPEDFFIPYVWSLVTKSGCIHFSAESMKGVTLAEDIVVSC